ncbi:biotin transporter BioY [Shimia marina]|uniref:Biotin transporter n=1 Tax=Shimia marina TaxID=321267 RepID=A0A0P1EUD1_9RHOB|nr:biotin transporter BioY [Shimia marina]CUH54011.1 Biotin ECF transporter S component BioY [Shimia marina]SFE16944.1 biotin transport system substrate-specific component [Shimia marina]
MTTKDIVYIALFAALTAALGLMPPIHFAGAALPPITAQSLGVMLAGAVLGAKRGGFALLLFIALVAVGLPLLSGGRGGFGVLLGTSGGFLLAWPFCAALIGYLIENDSAAGPVKTGVYVALGGIALMYAAGIPWMAFIGKLGLGKSLSIMVAYVPGDLVKVVLATLIARGLRRAYPNL